MYKILNKVNFFSEGKNIYIKNPNIPIYTFYDSNITISKNFKSNSDSIIIAHPSVSVTCNPHKRVLHDTIVLPNKYAKQIFAYNEKAALFTPNLFLYLIKKLDLPYEYISNIDHLSSSLEYDVLMINTLKTFTDNKQYSPTSYNNITSLDIFGDAVFVRKVLPTSNIHDLLSFNHSGKNENNVKIAFCFLMRTVHNQPKVWESFFENETDYKVFIHTTEYVNIEWNIPFTIVNKVDSQYLFVNKVYRQLMSKAIEADDTLTHFIFLSESCVPIQSMNEVRKLCIPDSSWIEKIPESFAAERSSTELRLSLMYKDILKINSLTDKFTYNDLNLIKHKPHFILCRRDVKDLLNAFTRNNELYDKIPSGNEHFLSLISVNFKSTNKFYMNWDSSMLKKKFYNELTKIEQKYKQYFMGLNPPRRLCDSIILDYILNLNTVTSHFLAMNPSIFYFYATIHAPYGFWNHTKYIVFYHNRFVDSYDDYWTNKLRVTKYFNSLSIPKALNINDYDRYVLVFFPQHIVLNNVLKKKKIHPLEILYLSNSSSKEYYFKIRQFYLSLKYFYPHSKYYSNLVSNSFQYDLVIETIEMQSAIKSLNYNTKYITLFVHTFKNPNDFYEKIKHYKIIFLKLEEGIMIVVLNPNVKSENPNLLKEINDLVEKYIKKNLKIFKKALELLILDLEDSPKLNIKKLCEKAYKKTMKFFEKYDFKVTKEFKEFTFP